MLNLRTNRFRNKASAFTLVELTVTILILGILAAVATPIYTKSLFRFRADVASRRIAQDIAYAQQVAVQTNSSQRVSFNVSNHSYALIGVASLDRVSEQYQVFVNGSPYQAEIFSLVTAGSPAVQLATLDIVFDRFGMPDQGISVTVQTGGVQKRIDVAPITGRVSIQ